MENKKEDDNNKNTIWIVIGCCSLLLIVNLFYYCKVGNNGLSLSPEQWGQYGDFIGGFLNPILAIVNIFALMFLTYKVSHLDDNRFNEQKLLDEKRINEQRTLDKERNIENDIFQKNITLTQMRYDLVSKFSANTETMFASYSHDSNFAKPLNMLLAQLTIFETSAEYLFDRLFKNGFKKNYITPLSNIINELIAYYGSENPDAQTEFEIMKRFGITFGGMTRTLNRFIVDEISTNKAQA